MRQIKSLLLLVAVVLLHGCSGSDTYRGTWKAIGSEGEKLEITFEAKRFYIKDSSGKINHYDYSQNSVSIENSVETYGIRLNDGREYYINFPIADDETKGIIKDAVGNPMYTISKTAYIKYEDIYKLK
ncbi:hypothetical protein [Ferruginibacter albus]|uniref:hypothetical protein n=1 Tax=Ferruginibacter albus TaxID=2875540 RepID=UPI001CC6D8E0|nr:hypothetical protein [Ferruginibacter albus]UAY53402.1 hypothetical protein K9M53_06950 [Ferruginibacter albus]